MSISFPDDLNGDVLRRMQDSGVDFSEPREFDFVVIFPSKPLAEAFAQRIKELGYTISVEESGCVPERPYDARIKRTMMPSHAKITEFENTLSDLAEPFGGRNDGWGTLVPPTH
jgi:regulator of ribonuclease activity B